MRKIKWKLFWYYGIRDWFLSKFTKAKCTMCGRPARILEYYWFCKSCFLDEFDCVKLSDWWTRKK